MVLITCIVLGAIFVIGLFDYERMIRKVSVKSWYRSPLCVIGAYNSLLRIISINKPFLSLAYYPGHQLISQNFELIQNEILTFLDEQKKTREFGEVETMSKRISSERWQCFFIKCYGDITGMAREFLPHTSQLIESQKQVRLAMLSILEPGASIKPHWGPSKACYRYHMTIQCDQSGKAFISVDNIKYHWKEGEGILFDDTFEHFVENDTDNARVVLFCDIERQLLFPFNVVNKFLLNQVGKVRHLKKIKEAFD